MKNLDFISDLMGLIKWPVATAVLLASILAYYLLLSFYQFPTLSNNQCQKQKQERPEPPVSSLKYRDYTLSELLPFNGQDEPFILISLDQRVFDVSTSPQYYGQGASYSSFSGRDASRALATNKIIPFEGLQDWDDLEDLTPEQRNVLNGWVTFYESKYPRVGTLVTVHMWAGSDQEEDPLNAKLRGHILEDLDLGEELNNIG